MADIKKVDDLLKQPMNRRQFLRNIGLLLISLVGISNALHILSGGHNAPRVPAKKGTSGYGSSKFGI